MTPRDFCYWLQGFFEIAEVSEDLWQSDRVREIIQNHINLVKATPGDYLQEMNRFMGWIESCLEFRGTVSQAQEKLNKIFEHVIDPQTSGDQGLLNQTHKPIGGGGARC